MRRCRYLKEDNCSIVDIRDNEVFLFDKKIIVIANTETDWLHARMIFYYTKNVDSNDPIYWEKLALPLNVGMEVINAFHEVDQENQRRIESLFVSDNSNNNELGVKNKKKNVPKQKNTSGVTGTTKKKG
jgi:hypothetical protein